MRQNRLLTLLLTAVFATAAMSACGKDKNEKKAVKRRPKVKRKSKKKAAAKRKKKGDGDKKAGDSDKKAAEKKRGDKEDKVAEAKADDNAAPGAKGEKEVGMAGTEARPGEEGKPAGEANADPTKAVDEATGEGAKPTAAPAAPVAAEAKGAGAEPTPEEALAQAEALQKAEADAPKPEEGAAPPGEKPATPAAAPANAAAPAAAAPQPPATGVMPKGAPKLAPVPHVIDKPVKRPDPPLDVTGYVSAADLERVLGKKHKFRRSDLPGVNPTKAYNALYYESTKKGVFGVSVQVWRDLSLVDSRTRFNAMRNTYNDVVPTDKVAEQGFRAHFAGVVTLVFADARKPVVAAVSCSVKLCTPDAIIELSRRVSERIR